MQEGHRSSGPDPATLLFAAWQTTSQANGGLASFTELLRGLGGRRVVLTQMETRATETWRQLGCEVHVWPIEPPPQIRGLELAVSRARRTPHLAWRNLRLARLVRSTGARVVHCNDISAFWFAAPGARLAGARVVFNVRDMFPPETPYGPRWKAIRVLADEVVCLSEEMRTEVLERIDLHPALASTVARANVRYIYSAVDLERLRPASDAERSALRERTGLPKDAFVVAYVGTFCEKKNQLGFIEKAMPELLARRPDAHVVFVGDFEPARDAYAARCEARVRELGLGERVTFAGFTADPASYYRAADVTALTSRYEGLPRCMIESLACGVPVVAFDVTSVREFLDARGAGVAVRWGDYPALQDALVRLADDRGLAREMGARGRAAAEACFRRDRAVEAYRRVYEALGAAPAESGPASPELAGTPPTREDAPSNQRRSHWA